MRAKAYISCLYLLGVSLLFLRCSLTEESSNPERTPRLETNLSVDPGKRLDRLYYLPLEQNNIPKKYQELYGHLKKAAVRMDSIFWKQSFGNKESLLREINNDTLYRLVNLNYGPYDRLDNNYPLIEGLEAKSKGANFYPSDIRDAELPELEDGMNKFTLIRRDSEGELYTMDYADAYREDLKAASSHLRDAASLLSEGTFKQYLTERAQDLENNEYLHTDRLWLDLWEEPLDILIGPIESYEDNWKGLKASYQSCIVLRDAEESMKIRPLVELVADLEMDLDMGIRYDRGEFPKGESVGVYKALFFSGLFNAGSKSMGLNFPLRSFPLDLATFGKRRMIFNNIVEAKYTHIALPVAKALVDSNQVKSLNYRAFFEYVLFHELSHGWEIIASHRKKKDLSVQENLLGIASILEEGKGDILGLFMIVKAFRQGLMKEGSLESHYTTCLVNTLRALRFGLSSDHAIANMIRLNYFLEQGAFVFDEAQGKFSLDSSKMEPAIRSLTNKILDLQAEGNADKASNWARRYKFLSPQHQALIDQCRDIPIDLRFQ